MDEKILIVEDDLDIAKLMRIFLKSKAFRFIMPLTVKPPLDSFEKSIPI